VNTKTDWYSAGINPVHEGLYEVERPDMTNLGVHMLLWNGIEWRYAYDLWHAEACTFAMMGGKYGDRWRGLTEPAVTK
jgi:hypothetical protein